MTKVMEAVETVEEGIQHLRERTDVVREDLRHAAVQAKDKVTEAFGDAQRYVQKHPLHVIGASLTIGALIGALLARRRGE